MHCKHVSADTAYYVGIAPIESKELGINPGLFYSLYNDERKLILHNYANISTSFTLATFFINSITGDYNTFKDTTLTLSSKDTTYINFNY